jgi:dephospho-CoA kinase
VSKLLGITGTIGSGKSTVGAILQAKGITVVDTDTIVHELLANSPSVKQRVMARFGTVDRGQLGALVFRDRKAKEDLEAILHPETIEACRQIAGELAHEKVIAFLVPLLFEAKLEGEYDQIWSVQVDAEKLRERLKKRNGFTDEEIDARLANQLSQEVKAEKAHFVIDNSGTAEETQAQVEKLLGGL